MTFFEVINSAIADFLKHGFDDVKRLDHWLLQIKMSAQAHLMSEREMQHRMEKALRGVFERLVNIELIKYACYFNEFVISLWRY